VIIRDVKKWFGGADIRLDTLVVHGYGQEEDPASFYAPCTYRFTDVHDREELPIDTGGLLLFHGKPLHFLDLFITVSRDRKDSDELASLLKQQSEKLKNPLGALLALTISVPQAAAITTAIRAAGLIGDVAYQILRQVAGSTIGLYHASWLQFRDSFGVGRHPESRSFRAKGLSFWTLSSSRKVCDDNCWRDGAPFQNLVWPDVSDMSARVPS
jgi:hypothetical protein